MTLNLPDSKLGTIKMKPSLVSIFYYKFDDDDDDAEAVLVPKTHAILLFGCFVMPLQTIL